MGRGRTGVTGGPLPQERQWGVCYAQWGCQVQGPSEEAKESCPGARGVAGAGRGTFCWLCADKCKEQGQMLILLPQVLGGHRRLLSEGRAETRDRETSWRNFKDLGWTGSA